MAEEMKVCPNCLDMSMTESPDYISCKHCGIHGNPTVMKWCKKVPIFNIVKDENIHSVREQLYKQVNSKGKEEWFVFVGWVEGCGRYIPGEFCMYCRSFLPKPSEKSERKSSASIRKSRDGKMAAAGEEK
jgi:hypothetical protein